MLHPLTSIPHNRTGIVKPFRIHSHSEHQEMANILKKDKESYTIFKTNHF